MANVKDLVPFILYFEAGVSRHYISLPQEELFERAKKTGFANDTADRGGATMCGVTLATYQSFKKGATVDDLKAISYDEWLSILKTMFWDRWKSDEIVSQPIANILVDWVWASGKYGIITPQKILGVTADGIVGPKTLAALNAADPQKLFSQIHNARVNYIESICTSRPANKKFYKGWMRRLNAITYDGLTYPS